MKRTDGISRLLILVSYVSIALMSGAAYALCNGSNENGTVQSTTPTENFVASSDGSVTDKSTGLTWKRCSEGQSWDGSSCSGSARGFTWQEALALKGQAFAGRSDWRLPNVKELASLVEDRCWNPAINVDVFPGTPYSSSPYDNFWSSSPGNFSDAAFSVRFRDGVFTSGLHKDARVRVRLVRSGL